jgi:hypothetical protein
MCVRVCVRACASVRVRACVRACVRGRDQGRATGGAPSGLGSRDTPAAAVRGKLVCARHVCAWQRTQHARTHLDVHGKQVFVLHAQRLEELGAPEASSAAATHDDLHGANVLVCGVCVCVWCVCVGGGGAPAHHTAWLQAATTQGVRRLDRQPMPAGAVPQTRTYELQSVQQAGARHDGCAVLVCTQRTHTRAARVKSRPTEHSVGE